MIVRGQHWLFSIGESQPCNPRHYHVTGRCHSDGCGCGKRHFLSHLCTKCIILPRQARDKHRENSKKGRFLQAAVQRLKQPDERGDGAAPRDGPWQAAGSRGAGWWGAARLPTAVRKGDRHPRLRDVHRSLRPSSSRRVKRMGRRCEWSIETTRRADVDG